MANSAWHESILKQYVPTYLSEKYFKQILRNFKRWEPIFRKEDRARDALKRVRNIKSDNDSKELIHHIVMVCFLAREYDKTIVDSSKTFRDEIKALDDNMVSQKKLIKELNKLLKECSKGSVSYSNVIPKTSINESARKLLAPLEPNVANYLWSPDFIHEVLEAYLKFLPSPFGGRYLKDHSRPLEFYEIRLGALEYPKRPAKQAHRKKLQENSLIFNLAFLFRHFTKKSNKGHWLTSTKGALPKSGRSCYEMIGDFANAVFYSSGEKNSEDKEFTFDKIKKRITSLDNLKVRLGSWFGI